HMPPPQRGARSVGKASERFSAELRRGDAQRRWEIWRCAHQHHRINASWLRGTRMEERLRAHAHADGLHAIDLQVIEQGEDIIGTLPEREALRRARRAAVAA